MKLAFSISGHRDSAGAVQAAVAAEAAGFDDVWLTEDYVERGAFALAGAIAARTSRVRVGIGVVNPWTRHPTLIAMEFATLDEISGGRAVLGLGASNEHWMSGQLVSPSGGPSPEPWRPSP
jgi:5,10-methylenetetrahydromethanopterin reductase